MAESGRLTRIPHALHGLWLERLTPGGRAVFAAGLLVTAVANASYVVKSYYLFCLLVSMALASLAMARLSRVVLKVEWLPPERTACGARVSVPVEVRNPTRRGAVDVALRPLDLSPHLRLLPAEGLWIPSLQAGESRSLCMQIETLRRGHYLLPGVMQEGWFPFGLWRDLVRHAAPRRMLVYPAFSPLVGFDVPVGMRHHPGGIALSSDVGESTEFIGARDFRYGDRVRDIHWRSWARVGHPVVKEFQEEFFCRIALLLDTFVPSREEKMRRPAFEASLTLAAAVADQLGKGEYVVDLFAAGPDL